MKSASLKSWDKTELFYRLWEQPQKSPLAFVLHGFAEHGGLYLEVAQKLYQQGFHVAILDLRGHGKSQGNRGYIASFEDYIKDLNQFYKILKDLNPTYMVLFAHSMGGLLGIQWTLRYPHYFRYLILSAPLLGIEVKASVVKKSLGHMMSCLWPTFSLSNNIEPTKLSHDTQKVKEYQNDPLVFKTVTARWYTEISKMAFATLEDAKPLQIPVLLQLPGEDFIVNSSASVTWFNQLNASQKALKPYPGLYHALWHEQNRDQVLEDALGWMEKVSPQVE